MCCWQHTTWQSHYYTWGNIAAANWQQCCLVCVGLNMPRCACVKKKQPCINCAPLHSKVSRDYILAYLPPLPRQPPKPALVHLPLSLPTWLPAWMQISLVMKTAFGEALVHSEPSWTGEWYNRWLSTVKLNGKLYSVSGGAVGRKYV